MRTVTSKEGTTIAFDLFSRASGEPLGEGSAMAAAHPVPIILVDGALQYRAFDQGMGQLAELLAQRFTVFHYDRRGRGDSTDTQPYRVERESEDIEAL